MANSINAKNLDALERAVNDLAGKSSGLWLSFVTLATYLIIATGSVTHVKLLAEEPLTLPVLNVDLPLLGFFVVGPAFFLLFHFFLFLQLQGLSYKIGDYNEILREQVSSENERRLIRQRLDSFVFVQLLAGPRERREGYGSSLLQLMAWITMVGLPLATLMYIDFTFLPYHSEPVTWGHRAFICGDLALIWGFWPVIHRRARLLPFNTVF